MQATSLPPARHTSSAQAQGHRDEEQRNPSAHQDLNLEARRGCVAQIPHDPQGAGDRQGEHQAHCDRTRHEAGRRHRVDLIESPISEQRR